MMKKFLFLIIPVFIFCTFLVFFFQYVSKQKLKQITSFEKCALVYPVLESYPPQCKTPDGRIFSQDVGNGLSFKDEIVVTSPRPLDSISSPLVISGKAKGQWFFEGIFNAELTDGNGKSLGKGIIHSKNDWMSQDFVNFAGTLTFTTPATLRGTLLIKNANPSGLPKNEKKLIIPVSFQKAL